MSHERFTALAELAQIDKDKLKQLYTLAQIECLSEMKDKTVRWAGTWAVVFTLAISLLGYFGINQLIINLVSTKVLSVMAESRKEVQDAQVQVQVLAKGIEKEVIKREKTLTDIKETENRIKKKIADITPFVGELARFSEQVEFKLVLDNVIADFYTIKDVVIHVDLKYSKDIDELRQKIDLRNLIVNHVSLLRAVDSKEKIGQFYADDKFITQIGDRGLAYSFEWFAPFRNSLRGQVINKLKAGALRFYFLTSNEQLVDEVFEAFRFLEEIHFQFEVNGVRIISEQVDEFKFLKSQNDGNFVLSTIHDLGEKLKNPQVAFDTAVSTRIADLQQSGVLGGRLEPEEWDDSY